MQTETYTLESEVRDGVEIEVTIDWEWENDGIGLYEYWGSVEIDRGVDYVVPSEINWDKTGFTEQEIATIEKEIDSIVSSWANSVKKPEPDYD